MHWKNTYSPFDCPNWSGLLCSVTALAGFCLPFGWTGGESFSLYQFYLRNGNGWFSWVLMAYLAMAAAYCLLGCRSGAALLELLPAYCCWRVMESYASAMGSAWALSHLGVGAWLHGAGLLGLLLSLPFCRLDQFLSCRLLSLWRTQEDNI